SKLSAAIVSGEADLKAAIADAHKAGQRPVVIAHNAGGRFNFAKPVGISSLQDPDVVVLTCSSYAESSLGAQTTADLDVESMFRALESTSAAFPNGSSTDQFLFAFAKAYSEEG